MLDNSVFAAPEGDHSPGLVVDLFAGGGGASTGLEAALGRSVDVAINHNEVALAVHAANHPGTRHIQTDIFDVKPREATQGRPVDVLWSSPACFPAGAMVLAREGYRAIESLQVGDEVLTHLGRWRKVTATMNTVRPLVRIRGYGHPGLVVSPEHPLFTRTMTRKWRTQPRGYQRVFSDPDWTRAGDIAKGHYWATPTAFPEATPPEIPTIIERQTDITPALMWLVGRYIADGSTRLDDTHADLTISVGNHKVEAFRTHIATWEPSGSRAGSNELSWQERAMDGCVQFTTSHRGLVPWLKKNFGSGCEHKFIPGWALGMGVDLRRALLEGYLSGDGYVGHGAGNPLVQATSVSKALAFGIKALAESLGRSVSVYIQENSNVIQGRTVNVLPCFQMRWRSQLAEGHAQTVREGLHEWAPIRAREDLGASAAVFNISVEEDETYVVEGVVVHNCTHFSRARGKKPVTKQERSLAWVVTSWANDVRPRLIFVENVPEFLSWGPATRDGEIIEGRKGETFRRWVRRLQRLGYAVDWRVLDASHYGAPTRRKRLFVVARCDGKPIRWPTPTHGEVGELFTRPVCTAAECIDWSIPTPSIFEPGRDLVEASLKRIAEGMRRFVFESPNPYIVEIDGRSAVPFLVARSYGEREGQAPRCMDIRKPLGTVVAGGQKHALVAAFLASNFGGEVGIPLTRPMRTITARDHHSLVTVKLDPTEQPERVAAFLASYYGQGVGQSLRAPMRTSTTKDRFALVTVRGTEQLVADIGYRMLEPHELLRAQFGQYAEGYDLSAARTKAAKVRLIGNSVAPAAAEALVRANYSEVANVHV